MSIRLRPDTCLRQREICWRSLIKVLCICKLCQTTRTFAVLIAVDTFDTLSCVLILVKILSVMPSSALSAGTKLLYLSARSWSHEKEDYNVPPNLSEVNDQSNLFHVDAFPRVVRTREQEHAWSLICLRAVFVRIGSYFATYNQCIIWNIRGNGQLLQQMTRRC